MSVITEEMTVNQVTQKYPQTMKVFSDHKVDSCCGGAQSVKASAQMAGADLARLIAELNEVAQNSQ